MTCGNCGATMHLDRTQMLNVCGYCGTQAELPTGSDGVQVIAGTPYRCPLCEDAKLDEGRLEQRPVHHCQTCGGILVAIGSFLPIVEALRMLRDRPAEHLSPRSSHDADRAMPCPLCKTKMLNYAYGGGGNVHLDSCRVCDVIWLDRSELRRIVIAPDPRPIYVATDILES